MSTSCTCSRARPRTHVRIHVCARHTRIDVDGEALYRGTDLLRGRPGSCPTLSRYTIIFFVVCALVSPRERYRPSFFSSPSRPPTLLSLDRCCGRVFRPSFIRVSSPFVNSTPQEFLLPRRSFRRFVCLLNTVCIVCSSPLNWIIYENDILLKERICSMKKINFNWRHVIISHSTGSVRIRILIIKF